MVFNTNSTFCDDYPVFRYNFLLFSYDKVRN